MKKIGTKKLELISGGDDIDDFVGGLACGASVASILFNPFAYFIVSGGWIAGAGCANYLR